jgi:hypothetical protein
VSKNFLVNLTDVKFHGNTVTGAEGVSYIQKKQIQSSECVLWEMNMPKNGILTKEVKRFIQNLFSQNVKERGHLQN